MSQQSPPPENKPRFSADDLFVYVVGTVIAAPLGKAGVDALLVEDYIKGSLALLAGISFAACAFTFKLWKSGLNDRARDFVQKTARHRVLLGVGAITLAGYAFVVVPEFLRTATRKSDVEVIFALKSELSDAVKKIASLSSQLEAKDRELTAVRQALESEQKKHGEAPAVPPAPPISADEIRARKNAWKIVDGQLTDFERIFGEVDDIIATWASVRTSLTQKIFDLRQHLGVERNRLNISRQTYSTFADLRQIDSSQLENLALSIESLLQASSQLRENVSATDFQATISPYVDAVSIENERAKQWLAAAKLIEKESLTQLSVSK
jgi:hypothetical protein